MLPLDLHVLSLQLAFILSQDQTLHCKSIVNHSIQEWLLLCSGRSNLKSIYYLLLSNDGSFYFTQDRFFFRNKSCSCTTCIVYVNLFKDRFFYVGFLFRKADAKVKTFKYIFQIFSEVFFSSFLFPVISLAKGRTKERLFYRPGFKKKCQPTLLTF